jgi:L-threonylcarbamoyladenylate synthase
MNAVTARHGEALLGFGATAGAALNLSPSGDLIEAAANLFAMMRTLDRAPYTGIAVAPVPETGLGVAINDRLRRAAYGASRA